MLLRVGLVSRLPVAVTQNEFERHFAFTPLSGCSVTAFQAISCSN